MKKSEGNFVIKINFKKIGHENYGTVLGLCENMPLFEYNDQKDIYELIINKEQFLKEFYQLTLIWGMIKSWDGSEIKLDDKAITFEEVKYIFMTLRCENDCKEKDKSCEMNGSLENPWPCKQLEYVNLSMVNPREDKEVYWYQIGEFKSRNVWKINKEEIKKKVNDEINLKRLKYCSFFDYSKVINTIEGLPDEIDIDKSDNWIRTPDLPSKISFVNSKRELEAKKTESTSILDKYLKEIKEGKAKAGKKERSIPNIKYSDIGGIDELVQQIRETIELPLKAPRIFDHLGIKPHKGVLLYGPPGCGKTLVAKAVANEVNTHFIPIKASELLSMWYGNSEANVREVFEEAKEFQPSIIYFDEIDSIGRKRTDSENSRNDAKVLNQLLSLMDGIEEYGNIIVMGSTNKIDILDSALLRPGRFDLKIEIKKPNAKGCKQILRILTKKMPIGDKVNLEQFSGKLVGLSGAEIAFVTREAGMNCLRRNLDLKSILQQSSNDNIDYSKLMINEHDFIKALSVIKKEI